MKALLALHYGTPKSLDQVLPYYTHIRRGRPPSDDQLEDLVARYHAIGGLSRLNEISSAQAAGICTALAKRGVEARPYVGARHALPFIADTVEAMAGDGVLSAVGLVLTPQYSSYSVAQYRAEAMAARDRFAPTLSLAFVERWGALPAFISFLAGAVRTTMAEWDPESTLVIFTAHSLPLKAVADGDPYPDELTETSRLVAGEAKLPSWSFAYQSASETGEPWLGPDILETIERAEADGRTRNVLACPVGFVSDHLEVLYDLDVEAHGRCESLGLGFRRTPVVNTDPGVMAGLAGLVAKHFE